MGGEVVHNTQAISQQFTPARKACLCMLPWALFTAHMLIEVIWTALIKYRLPNRSDTVGFIVNVLAFP